MKSMRLFPGCRARNGTRPMCSLRGTARRPPAGGFFLQPLLPAEAVPRRGKSRMGPATPPADSHGGRTSGGRGSVRAPGGGAGVRAAERAAGDGSPHRAPCGRQGSSSPLAAAAAAHPRTCPAARKRRREGGVRSLAVCSSLGFRSDRDPATSPVPADVSRRRVTGHGQSTASTQPLRITARREFAVCGTVHLRGTAVASSAQVCADRSLRPPAASQAGHVRARPSDVRRGLPASCS